MILTKLWKTTIPPHSISNGGEYTTIKIFEGIKNDKIPKPGSQKGRVGFEPNKRLTLVKN